MGKAKPTIAAAKAAVKRDLRKSVNPPTGARSQESIGEKYIRNHTPERLYGPKDKDE
ncbi:MULTISPECIES: hypothetical protein [unclassified Streptomyces]|uniref:hypothetical protein n=1 Tax=unclassified Streptomyces TaxID=2593676 RepID=UPI002E2D9460|nr:hypothetical protein [Streptomyces sp. NBC_00223]